MSVKAILFDFGGVFTKSPFDAVEQYGHDIGAKPGQATSILFGDYGQDTDHPWHRLERGEIALDEARAAISVLGRDLDLEIDVFEAFSRFPRDGGIRKFLVDYVHELKQAGYLLSIVTNNIREFSSGWRALLPVDELFDDVVDSCEVGMRKPNHAIYQLALSRLGNIPAEASVFIDDYAGNVEAARQIGMRGIHVQGDTDAKLNEAILELQACLTSVSNEGI